MRFFKDGLQENLININKVIIRIFTEPQLKKLRPVIMQYDLAQKEAKTPLPIRYTFK